MHRHRLLLTIGIALAFGLVASSATDAQMARTDEARAQSLWTEARQLVDSHRLGEADARVRAAALLERSAVLRNDPFGEAAFEAMWEAGHLYYYAERPRKALRALERAAEIAGRRGEVYLAADTHLRIAHLSAELGDVARVVTHRDRARHLAHSSHLRPEEVVSLNGGVALIGGSEREEGS